MGELLVDSIYVIDCMYYEDVGTGGTPTNFWFKYVDIKSILQIMSILRIN